MIEHILLKGRMDPLILTSLTFYDLIRDIDKVTLDPSIILAIIILYLKIRMLELFCEQYVHQTILY